MKCLATSVLVAAACVASAATVLTGDGFVEFPHGVKPKCATSFRIDVDGGVLTCVVDCRDPDPARLHAGTGEGFRHADHVELFLSPDGNVQNYYQFMVPIRGAERFAAFFAEKGGIQPDPYDPEWEGTAELTPCGWRATFRMPLSSFYMTRNSVWSETWLVNVTRNSRNQGELSTWKRVVRHFHEPDMFAKVGGFPARDKSDDVFIESASCEISSMEGGEYVGAMKVRASAAIPGEFEFTSSASGGSRVQIKPSGVVWTVPCRFPETGRNRTRLSLRRASDGREYARFYPVAVSYEPLKVRLTTPAYRNNFYPGDATAKVEGSVESLAKGAVSLVLTGDGIGEVRKTLPGSGKFSFDTGAFTRGEMTLVARCGDAEKRIRIRKIEPNGRRMAWVRNGTLVMDGRPLYRCGMGAEGYKGGTAFARRYFADETLGLDRDFCRGARLEPSRLVKGIEQREAKKDVRPSQEVFDAIDRVMDSVKDKDFAWYYLCDEPEMRGVSEVYLKHLYEHIRERDPYHVVRIASRDAARFVECADWFEAHPYLDPYTDGEGMRRYQMPMNKFGDYISSIDDLHRPDKVIGTLPTCFSYKFNNPASDYPTLDEYWCSTWAAAIRGAKSSQPFFYADMGDRVWLYEGTGYLFNSYHALDRLLLFADRSTVSRTQEHEAVLYTLPDERMLVAVNFLNTPQEVRFDGLGGDFVEFRGDRAWKGGEVAVRLKPLEVLIATTKRRDAGLQSQKGFREYAAAKEYERTHRDNQLFGRDGDISFGSSSSMVGLFNTSFKLYDGVRDVYAWAQGPAKKGEARFLEMTVARRPPAFRRLRLYGHNLDGTVVSVRRRRKWETPPVKVSGKDEFFLELDFGEVVKASCVRFEFPQEGGVELYEIEMPRTAESDAAFTAGGARETPKGDIGWSMPSLFIDTATNALNRVNVEFDPEFPWVEFRLDEAKWKENPKWKYHAWEVKALSPGAPWAGKIAGDVIAPMTGVYVQHLPVSKRVKGSIATYGYNFDIRYGFFRLVRKPANALEAVAPSGKATLAPGDSLRIALDLAEPCEDVACDILKAAAGGAKPWKVNGESSVRLEPLDGSLRRWAADVKIVSCGDAKARELRVRCTVFGSALDVPVITTIPYAFSSKAKD